MKFIYDEESNAGYLNIVESATAHTRETLHSHVMADYDENGQLVGLEIQGLPPSDVLDENQDPLFEYNI